MTQTRARGREAKTKAPPDFEKLTLAVAAEAIVIDEVPARLRIDVSPTRGTIEIRASGPKSEIKALSISEPTPSQPAARISSRINYKTRKSSLDLHISIPRDTKVRLSRFGGEADIIETQAQIEATLINSGELRIKRASDLHAITHDSSRLIASYIGAKSVSFSAFDKSAIYVIDGSIGILKVESSGRSDINVGGEVLHADATMHGTGNIQIDRVRSGARQYHCAESDGTIAINSIN